jgi:hypothetical protein
MISSCLGPRRSCCGFVLHQEGLNPVVMLLLAVDAGAGAELIQLLSCGDGRPLSA